MRIQYGEHAAQFVDVRLPATSRPVPLAIVVHGGFWSAQYDLEHLEPLCQALNACGIATWNIEYRRLGHAGGGWMGTFADVAQAADLARQYQQKFNFDLARMITLGHSAGGHLAMWLAGRRRIPKSSPLWHPDPVQLAGAVSLAGVLDLHLAYEQRTSRRAVTALLGGSPSTVAERYQVASPAALLPFGVRQIIVHGTDDGPVPIKFSERYVELAHQAGDQIEFLRLQGAHHFEMINPQTREWRTVQTAVVQLLENIP